MALSRIAISLLALTTAAPALSATSGDALQRYTEKTSVAVRCTAPNGDAIIVCGRRAADKWRVPFIVYGPGDPRGESVSSERNRLASEPPIRCGQENVLRNCGFVGITVGARFGDGGVRLRPLAD